MKAYFFLILGTLWIITAVLFSRGDFSFGIVLPKGTINQATLAAIFRLIIPLIAFGWIVPTALGLWLLLARR